ncbi:hypothetical protein NDU88_002134 [Pleurodeles waltl]|uniref:Uncharacterized protein n=1 Tax=Pleurodeles waltl TaxID=8319 RepID=A0AAV7P5X5_PLEWA|nr:hypothetical protein NDU88_002134 [Pleurodeles waltl]
MSQREAAQDGERGGTSPGLPCESRAQACIAVLTEVSEWRRIPHGTAQRTIQQEDNLCRKALNWHNPHEEGGVIG